MRGLALAKPSPKRGRVAFWTRVVRGATMVGGVRPLPRASISFGMADCPRRLSVATACSVSALVASWDVRSTAIALLILYVSKRPIRPRLSLPPSQEQRVYVSVESGARLSCAARGLPTSGYGHRRHSHTADNAWLPGDAGGGPTGHRPEIHQYVPTRPRHQLPCGRRETQCHSRDWSKTRTLGRTPPGAQSSARR